MIHKSNGMCRVVSNGGVVQNPRRDHALGVTPGLESHKYSQAAGPYWLTEAIKVAMGSHPQTDAFSLDIPN